MIVQDTRVDTSTPDGTPILSRSRPDVGSTNGVEELCQSEFVCVLGPFGFDTSSNASCDPFCHAHLVLAIGGRSSISELSNARVRSTSQFEIVQRHTHSTSSVLTSTSLSLSMQKTLQALKLLRNRELRYLRQTLFKLDDV